MQIDLYIWLNRNGRLINRLIIFCTTQKRKYIRFKNSIIKIVDRLVSDIKI